MEVRNTGENAHIKAAPHSQMQGNLAATGGQFRKNCYGLDLFLDWRVQNQVKAMGVFSKSTPTRNQVSLNLAVR